MAAAAERRAVGTGGGLLERDAFVAAGAELVEQVASGGAGALFLVGEAGLGKTSVIGQVRQRAREAGLAVGLGRGHPMENGLPFGVLVQALDAVRGRGLLGEDAPDSLPAADWPAGYYRVLRWLQNRAGDPAFLAIDDLHWADADSVALVSFLCRRLDQVPLGLIASLRPWPARAYETAAQLVDEGHGLVLRLRPLSERAAGSLLDSRLGRQAPATARRRAFELSAGNPLLLEQLAMAMESGGDVPAAASPGVAASGNSLLLSRFAGLSESGMRCARAAAVLGAGFLPAIAAEVAGLDGAEAGAAIEALARTGLIEQRPGAAAEFVHPLFRQALYDDVPGPLRCILHARAFAVLHARGLDRQAAEHAVPGALSGDPEAVAVLEAAGRAARRAGAMATAVSWLDKAAAMAGERASVRLLLDRAEAHLVTGSAGTASGVYEMLRARDDLDSRTRLEIEWMLARAQATAGEQEAAAATFEHAAALATDADPAMTVRLLLDAAFCAWLAGGAAPAMDLAARARDLAAAAGTEAVRARADASWAEYAVSCASPDGIAAAEAAIDSWASGNLSVNVEKTARRGGWGTANSLASCALGLERLTIADRAYSIVRAAAEDAGMPWAAAGLAVGHSYTLFRMGHLDQAMTTARAAVSLAELVPLMDGYANAAMAYMNLYAGQLDESARLARHAESVTAERGHLLAQMFLCDALGHRRLREGAVTEACAAYDRLEGIHAQAGIQEPCLPAWPRHAMDAYLAAGRIGDAKRVLAWLDEVTPRLPCMFPRIAAASCRARLAELDLDYAAAEACYQSALALHGTTDLPIEYCETLLAYGGFLRRAGQNGRARTVLAQAAHVAEQAGARWLAGLAHEDLKRAGGRLRRHTGPPALSMQEERVAALVATGMTNAAVARQLSLSVSTIETHLERIYAKLGIHTRYELIVMKAAQGQYTP
jgi:DNA-binding CsgD family transcriptional regulator